jgi:dTDP-4-amino-4,6-dideoxygalactose transaminase
MDKVPFLDLTAVNNLPEVHEAISRVQSRSQYILGEEVEAFESEWASFVGANGCATVGSGMDALILGLLALGIGPGDEVIVPGHTFVATWMAVSAVGATPVPVDVSTALTIDAFKIEEAITKRTQAIIPVHLYGQPASMLKIMDIAKRYDLMVLEDAAQAHGAYYMKQRIGSIGDATAWSFYPTKNLGAMGDAGAVTSNDPRIIERVKTLRNYGSTDRDAYRTVGVNSRMDELQAAVLRAKLHYLDRWNARRKEIALAYLRGTAEVTSLANPGIVQTGHWIDFVFDPSSVWHQCVVLASNRGALRNDLEEAGVETMIHYPVPPHLQFAYLDLPHGPLDVTTQVASQVLSLPMGPHLTDEQVARVIAAVRDALRSH